MVQQRTRVVMGSCPPIVCPPSYGVCEAHECLCAAHHGHDTLWHAARTRCQYSGLPVALVAHRHRTCVAARARLATSLVPCVGASAHHPPDNSAHTSASTHATRPRRRASARTPPQQPRQHLLAANPRTSRHLRVTRVCEGHTHVRGIVDRGGAIPPMQLSFLQARTDHRTAPFAARRLAHSATAQS